MLHSFSSQLYRPNIGYLSKRAQQWPTKDITNVFILSYILFCLCNVWNLQNLNSFK